MQNGKIKPGDIQASSQYDHRHRPDNGRLHFQRTSSRTGAWSARINDKNQWFQVKFERAAKIRRVACQGRMDADQWVTKYTLEYSLDGKSWKDYGFNGKTTVGCQFSLSLSLAAFFEMSSAAHTKLFNEGVLSAAFAVSLAGVPRQQ